MRELRRGKKVVDFSIVLRSINYYVDFEYISFLINNNFLGEIKLIKR